MDTWKHKDIDMRQTWRNGDMETLTWRYENLKNQIENRSLGDFLNPLSVDEETNGSYPCANELNGLNGHANLNNSVHIIIFK
jgi:hypothetical protein